MSCIKSQVIRYLLMERLAMNAGVVRYVVMLICVVAASSSIIAQDEVFTYTPQTLGPVFDAYWQAFDRQYSYFSIKKDVDWSKLKEEFRPKALAAKNADELAKVLQQMLRPLNDIHVFVMTKEGKRLDTAQRRWNYNGNGKIVMDQLTDTVRCGNFAIVGKTKPDGFGYFLMANQSSANPAVVKQAVEEIRKLKDASGFIVDLRRANGGNEALAREIAQCFCAKEVVYAKSKFRSGTGHTDFGKDFERKLPASKEEPYTRPVVCLIGEGAISSGEGFAKMMKALPHVTMVGLPTAGASGNPGPIAVGKTGIQIYCSRWVDMLPDGTTVEGKGVPPTVEVKVPPETYRTSEPTLEKALELLRKK
jgi:hypothetical protein